MDWNTLLHSRGFRDGLSLLLVLSLLLGLCLPGGQMRNAQPEDPLEDEGIREITVLKVGDNVSELNTIVIPSGGAAQPNETESEETDPDETKPEDTQPEETESEEPDVDDGEEGQEDDNQGEEGGEELELDLAMVMTWYQYGTQPVTITCAPSESVSSDVNTVKLLNNMLKYSFEPVGSDADSVEITSVTVAEGNAVAKKIQDSGELEIDLPEGTGDRDYTFVVTALAEKKNEQGEWVEQELTFTYVLNCGYALDLDLNLTWTKNDGTQSTITCGADKTEAKSVENNELHEGNFSYKLELTGALAADAKLISGKWTGPDSHSGELDVDAGVLKLSTEIGKDEGTYQLTFVAETPDREVAFTYTIVYRETLDAQLKFTWLEKGTTKRTMTCQPGGSVSENIRNNQLSAGGITYELALEGTDAEADGRIYKVTYTSEATGGGTLNTDTGSLPMSLPDGYTSNKYTVTVEAMVKGQNMTFEIVLNLSMDVSLEMRYSIKENGSNVNCVVTCENGKTVQAEAIYNDQLTDDMLSYKMTIVGADAGSAEITSVKCYQSGTGKEITLGSEDEIQLYLKNEKTGENTFTVTAQDDAGQSYTFKINIPYKRKGENSVKITTNLVDGQTVTNETKTNLTVTAWSEDSGGSVIDYIPANGTDTKLTVKLDDEELSYISSSGKASEYVLYPSNPVTGDTNTHTLYIYAEDSYGNYGELTLTLEGQRNMPGQVKGKANIYVDMTALGLGVTGPISYTVLADEPVSYTVAKAVLGEDTGEPFGAADNTLAWGGSYSGTLDSGFYLERLSPGYSATALESSSWPGTTEEAVLEAIDAQFGKGTGLASLWRCLYRNGLSKSSGSGSSFGEFDYTSGSGWLYSIGGSTYYPGQSMSDIYLQDGDVLTLRYTLAYGWDVGGGTTGYGNTVGYCVTAMNGSISISHVWETSQNEEGGEIKVCRCCGLVEDCDHELQWKDLENGYHIQYCTKCHETVGDPQKHIWDQLEQSENHTCTECGFSEAHRWKEVEGTNTATCTEAGVHTVTCTICEMTQEEEAAAKGHTYDNTWYHTESEHFQKCSTCEEEVNHGAHKYDDYDSGWDEYYCSICGCGHEWDYDCDGSRTVVTSMTTCQLKVELCSCGNYLYTPGTFDEYHSYVNGTCKYCGEDDPDHEPDETEPDETEPDETETHTHEWVDGETLEEPTCVEAGSREVTCSCGETSAKEIPATGHKWDEGTIEEDPTCTEEGLCEYTCTVCGDTKEESIPALGHEWSEWETVTEPEVGVAGEKYRYCKNCDAEETKAIDPLPEEEEASLFSWLFHSQLFLATLNNIFST